MARTEMVRFHCNYCSKSVDVPVSGSYPPGWKQFAARQMMPTEKEQAQVTDLCPEHGDNFLDYLHGREGPHRPARALPAEPRQERGRA
jgi:hypothetical protein